MRSCTSATKSFDSVMSILHDFGTSPVALSIAFSLVLTTIGCVGGNIHLRRVQSVRALLTALFMATQVIGVVPLLCDHTKEIYERAVAVTAAPAEAIPANAASDRANPDGDLDDDCCALHSLAGPLPNVASIAAGDLVSAYVLPKPASPLAGRHSRVLERPPKHTPSSDRTQA